MLIEKPSEIDQQIANMIERIKSTTKDLINQKKQEAADSGEDYFEFMDSKQVGAALVEHMPIIKLEEGEYLIGTEKKKIIVKANNLLIRVGGGYITLEEYITRNAPFECIKIHMHMKEHKVSFKKAVTYYLENLDASKRVVRSWLKAETGNQKYFEKTIDRL